jgi:hypothetical protein
MSGKALNQPPPTVMICPGLVVSHHDEAPHGHVNSWP